MDDEHAMTAWDTGTFIMNAGYDLLRADDPNVRGAGERLVDAGRELQVLAEELAEGDIA